MLLKHGENKTQKINSQLKKYKMQQFNNTHINFIIETANSKDNNFRKLQAMEQMVYNLAGPTNKDKRQLIYSELTGNKQTKAESGVNNILTEFKKHLILNKNEEEEKPAVQIEKLLSDLIDNRENNLSVKTRIMNLTPGSLGGPKIQVGTLPFYDYQPQEAQKLTFIVCCGRFITCEMLVYKSMLKDFEYLETQDPSEAKKYIRDFIQKQLTREAQPIQVEPAQPQEAQILQAKAVKQPIGPTEKTNFEIVNYSEKALAIFGDTKSIKEKLKNIGAKYNPYLTHNGNKTPGWILPATKQQLLNSII